MPNPTDSSFEVLSNYENNHCSMDVFFALSHGVNFGKLRKASKDEREDFLSKLLKKGKNINFHILGINNDAPKWNYDFYKEIMICKMSLNLSRGKPLKYASSNRIDTYMGNGILTFIDERVHYKDFFSENEMLFYKNENDLINQINEIKNNIKRINQISKNGKRKYFELFNNKLVSESILNKSLNYPSKFKYVWKK